MRHIKNCEVELTHIGEDYATIEVRSERDVVELQITLHQADTLFPNIKILE